MKSTFVFRSLFRRAKAALLAILTVTGPIAGEVRAESDQTQTDKTATETAGVMPSQQLQIETLDSKEGIITPKQVKEAIMNLNTNSVSPEYLGAAKDIFEKWEESTFGPYEDRLRKIEGAKEERIPFGARVWYCRNYAWSHADDVAKFQDYLGEIDIIDYVKGGKNPNVICDKEGNPRVWIVVKDKKYERKAIKSFSEAIKWYKDNQLPDMLESASENGLCVFFVANTEPDMPSYSSWLNQWGVVSINQNSENTKGIKDNIIRNQYISALINEPYGIIFEQVAIALNLWDSIVVTTGHAEVIKSFIPQYVSEVLKGKDKDGLYEMYADNFRQASLHWAQIYAKQGVTSDGLLTKRLLELMAEFVRIPGFGTLKNVETYNQAMASW